MSRKLIVYALGFTGLLPSVLAAPTVRSSLQGFVSGISTFTVSGFVSGLLAVLPLIGLIAVIFGLMFFVTRISIFRGEGNDKYARMVAIGISLLGLAQQKVFDAILGWTTSFLILLFMLAVVMMFIIFLNHTRTSHSLVATDLAKAQKDHYEARNEARKAKHEGRKLSQEINRDAKLFNRTVKDLDSLDKDLRGIGRLSGDELAMVDKLADLLRKATATSQKGETGNTHAYVQALTREIGSLVTSMQHDHKDLSHVHKMLTAIRGHVEFLFADEKQELSVDNHLAHLFKRHLKMHHGTDAVGMDAALVKEGSDIHKHLLGIRTAAKNLKSLETRVESHLETLSIWLSIKT